LLKYITTLLNVILLNRIFYEINTLYCGYVHKNRQQGDFPKLNHKRLWSFKTKVLLLSSLLLFNYSQLWGQSCPKTGSVLSINTNTTYSNTITFNNNVNVASGVTLTLRNGTFLFNQFVELNLAPGAHLIIENSTLQNSCAFDVWFGINAIGYGSASSSVLVFSNLSNQYEEDLTNNTTIKIDNSFIKNAIIGLNLSKKVICKVTKTSILDCETNSIKLSHNLTTLSQVEEVEYLSSKYYAPVLFQNCIFEWTSKSPLIT